MAITPPQLDKQSHMPLYQQVYEQLKRRIATGEWRPGQLVPAESQLETEYGVSRITIRQALDALAREGSIYRQRGKGTFISHPAVEQGLMRMISFEDDMISRGFRPTVQILHAHICTASTETAMKLDMPEGDELVRIEQLQLADDEPMSTEELYLVHKRVPGILDKAYQQTPLRELLARDYRIVCSHAKQIIRAAAAQPHQAKAMKVKNGFPLLYVERIAYSEQRQPLQYLRIFHRSDRYALHTEISG